MLENTIKYLSKHPMFNAMVHLSAGITVGIIIARPFDGGHPVQLAAIFAAITLTGYAITFFMKKVK